MTFRGLPAHPLLVHAVVIGLPLVALAVVLAALWPTARRRLGVVTPVAALVVVALVPLTVSAGRDLIRSVGGPNPAIAAHARAGSTLLPWAIGLFVVAVAVWLVGRRADAGTRPLVEAGPGAAATVRGGARTSNALRALTVVVAVVAVAVAVLATWQVVEIGESGARAVWGA